MSRVPLDLSIKLKYGIAGKYKKEKIESVEPEYIVTNAEGALRLLPILSWLEKRYMSNQNYMVSYYSNSRHIYIFQGQSPVAESLSIPISELADGNTLKLKLRVNSKSEITSLDEPEDDPAGKRTKERKIGYIIEKVARWRSLYNGIQNPSGETVRLTLEEAATQVTISKKSLDDYLLQLRFGRKYGFNFEEHKHEKVGILRNYVKKYKHIQNVVDALQTTDNLPSEIVELIKEPGNPVCKNSYCCVPPPGTFKNLLVESLISSSQQSS